MDKSVLTVNGRKFILDGEEYLLDDLFNKEFYVYSNNLAPDFYHDGYSVNEFFSKVQVFLAIELFIKNNLSKIEYVDIIKSDEDIRFFFTDIAKKYNVPLKHKKPYKRLTVIVRYAVFHFSSFVYLAYLMLKIPKSTEPIITSDKFAIHRFKGQFNRTKEFSDIHKELEDPYEPKSIYRFYSRIKRLGWVFIAYINSFSSLNKQKKFYEQLLGSWSVLALNNFYRKRIVHAELFKLLLDNYFEHFEGKSYYSMNNLDRFSVIEDQIAAKYHIKTYNLPHGIEYGYRFPKGFSSDVFFALTESSAILLNALYNTTKFIFEKDVASKLLKRDDVKEHKRHIVYFSEPREVYVNIEIIQSLIPKLKEKGWRLCLKLHGGDKKSDYNNLDVDFLTDFSEAISGNICISRKSTILLEAIYNDSIPIAIITNVKDQTIYNNFPSLQSERIIKTHTVDELMNEIESHY